MKTLTKLLLTFTFITTKLSFKLSLGCYLCWFKSTNEVCGSDNKTYDNECYVGCQDNVKIVHHKPCHEVL